MKGSDNMKHKPNPYFIIPIMYDEEYRVIKYPGIRENRYEVSNYGNVRRIYNKTQLHHDIDKDGYHRVCVSTTEKGHYRNIGIHRLVAWEFIGPYNDTQQIVNHKNSDRKFNYYENLEWVSREENYEHGRIYGHIGKQLSLPSARKHNTEDVIEYIKLIHSGYSNKQILNKFDYHGHKRRLIKNLLNDIRYGKCYKKEFNTYKI